ncbi:MAG: hypothetical protein AAFY21_19610, partial [Cyanobacteria bacterium J06641_2]
MLLLYFIRLETAILSNLVIGDDVLAKVTIPSKVNPDLEIAESAKPVNVTPNLRHLGFSYQDMILGN